MKVAGSRYFFSYFLPLFLPALPLPPLGFIPELLVAGDGVGVGVGFVVFGGALCGPGGWEGLSGEHPGGLAGGAHGDVFAGFGDEDVDAEDGGGDAADCFASGAAADEEDAVGVLLGGVFEGDHGVAHGAEYSFDGGAGDVFAGGVGCQSPEDAGGVVAVGGAFAVEVGQQADAVGAGLTVEG